MSPNIAQNESTLGGLTSSPITSVKPQNAFDHRLDHLIKDILPSSPYILRLQQSPGRRLPQPSQSYHWKLGDLFTLGEQELQYMTFRRPMDGMLQAHGQWDDGNGGIAPRGQNISHASSGQTPLQGSGVKKKITLADYKNRDKSKNGAKEAAPPQSMPAEEEKESINIHVDKKDIVGTRLEQSEGVQSVVAPQLAATERVAADEAVGMKRPAEVLNSVEPSKTDQAPSTPPTKKPRLLNKEEMQQTRKSEESLPKLDEQQAKSDLRAGESDAGNRKATNPLKNCSQDGKTALTSLKNPPQNVEDKKRSHLPPMLSPTLPTVEAYRLPPLLSPTLPPEIEAAIAEAKANRPRSNASFTSSTRDQSTSISSNRPRSDTATSLSQTSGDIVAKAKSPVPNAGRAQGDKPTLSGSQGNAAFQRIHRDLATLKLIVRLKIKRKQNRNQLTQYLRLKPTPSKVHWKKSVAASNSAIGSNPIETRVPNSKRERPQDEPELPKKRRRGSAETPKRAGTPTIPALSPLSTKPTSTQRTKLGTLPSQPTSAVMRRAGSGQSFAATPLGQSRHGTPSAIDKESPSKQALRAECRTESARLVNLGKDLKHDSDAYLKLENGTAEQERLGLVVATESVLCFVLAWVVSDEPSRRDGNSGNATQWKSILPLLRILTQRSKPYTPLHGLIYQLEGVIRDTIHHYDLFTLRSILRESERSTSTDQQEMMLQKHQSALKDCYENETKALTAWREGQAALWIFELQSAFPKTWGQARRAAGRGKGQDTVYIKEYTRGGFALPMGSLTNGLEAVNAGLSILTEHCKNEKINWKPKLVL